MKVGRSEKLIHDRGMMSQHSTMLPGARRQDVQWSSEIMGRCDEVVVGGWVSRDGMEGIFGRSSRGGTVIV